MLEVAQGNQQTILLGNCTPASTASFGWQLIRHQFEDFEEFLAVETSHDFQPIVIIAEISPTHLRRIVILFFVADCDLDVHGLAGQDGSVLFATAILVENRLIHLVLATYPTNDAR